MNLRYPPSQAHLSMFVEVNQPQLLLLRPPTGLVLKREQASALSRVAPKVAVVADPRDLATWRAVLPPDSLLLPFSENYLLPLQGNIRNVLDQSSQQPYECVCVMWNADDLREAILTRVGTVVVGPLHGHDGTIPDLILSSIDDFIARSKNALLHKNLGYLAEVTAERPNDQRWGVIYSPPTKSLGNPDWDGRFHVIALGRYFATGDARHSKHPLTGRIVRFKAFAGNVSGEPLSASIRWAMEVVAGRHCIEIVTAVPPSQDRHTRDNLFTAVQWATSNAQWPYATPKASRTALFCDSPYSPQKNSGSYANREANIAGKFGAAAGEVRGRTVMVWDDVLTSGASMREAARTLFAAGAKAVVGVVLGANQNVITAPPAALPCTARGCEGHLVMRFNTENHGAFWGCDRWQSGHPATCQSYLPWRHGLESLNKLNRRESIPNESDIPF